MLGVPAAGGRVVAPLGRHPVDRKRIAVVANGKNAITHYRVLERFRAHSLLQVKLETGRTHQIRVHMLSINHPLVGDPVYHGSKRSKVGLSEPLGRQLLDFPRQALHAIELSLVHPASGEPRSWRVPLPDDMCDLLKILRHDRDQQDNGDGT